MQTNHNIPNDCGVAAAQTLSKLPAWYQRAVHRIKGRMLGQPDWRLELKILQQRQDVMVMRGRR